MPGVPRSRQLPRCPSLAAGRHHPRDCQRPVRQRPAPGAQPTNSAAAPCACRGWPAYARMSVCLVCVYHRQASKWKGRPSVLVCLQYLGQLPGMKKGDIMGHEPLGIGELPARAVIFGIPQSDKTCSLTFTLPAAPSSPYWLPGCSGGRWARGEGPEGERPLSAATHACWPCCAHPGMHTPGRLCHRPLLSGTGGRPGVGGLQHLLRRLLVLSARPLHILRPVSRPGQGRLPGRAAGSCGKGQTCWQHEAAAWPHRHAKPAAQLPRLMG